jgi:hypothetical protein
MSVEIRRVDNYGPRPETAGCVAPGGKRSFPAPFDGYVVEVAIRSDGQCVPIDRKHSATICTAATADVPGRDAEFVFVRIDNECSLIPKQ